MTLYSHLRRSWVLSNKNRYGKGQSLLNIWNTMRLSLIFLMASLTCWPLWSATCDSKKIAILAVYQDTSEVPLLEDWSEASGMWRSVVVPEKKINAASFHFVDAKTKKTTRWNATIKGGKIEQLPMSKILGEDKKREGLLTISFFKDKLAVCNSQVNIHYADQLDFEATPPPIPPKKSKP